MTFEETLDRIRKKFPGYLIQTAWEFEDTFYFRISQGKQFVVNDLSVLCVSVNASNGTISTYGSGQLPIDSADEDRAYDYFRASCCNDRPIDITDEQYKELDESRRLLKAYWSYQRNERKSSR